MSQSDDRAAICDLLARYTYNGDRGRVRELASCFAPHGVLEFSGQAPVGPEAIQAALTADAGEPRPGFVRHHITHPLIEVDGERAKVRSYFLVLTNIGPDHAGTYSDELIRQPEGWRFARRLVRIDWQSPQSQYPSMATR